MKWPHRKLTAPGATRVDASWFGVNNPVGHNHRITQAIVNFVGSARGVGEAIPREGVRKRASPSACAGVLVESGFCVDET